MNSEAKRKSYFVGVRLTDAELSKLESVRDLLEPLTGERNLSNALRYMIRHFDITLSPMGKVTDNDDK